MKAEVCRRQGRASKTWAGFGEVQLFERQQGETELHPGSLHTDTSVSGAGDLC